MKNASVVEDRPYFLGEALGLQSSPMPISVSGRNSLGNGFGLLASSGRLETLVFGRGVRRLASLVSGTKVTAH